MTLIENGKVRRTVSRINMPKRVMRLDERPGKAFAADTPLENRADLLRELVAHLRQKRTQLREEWASRIRDTKLLQAMSEEEIFSESTSVYDNYVEVLETCSVEAL